MQIVKANFHKTIQFLMQVKAPLNFYALFLNVGMNKLLLEIMGYKESGRDTKRRWNKRLHIGELDGHYINKYVDLTLLLALFIYNGRWKSAT